VAVIARDTYEIVVKGGVETKDLLAAMNALLEEDRKRWADVAKVLGGVETALAGVGQGQREVQEGLGKTASVLLSVDAASNLVVKAWGAVRKAGELLAKPVGLAASFETEVAAIDTISNRAGTRFASTFLDISERLGIDAAAVARAGYEAVGSGVSEAALAQFTEISAELAIAGRAEVLPTLKLLTTAQNQFKLSIEEVQQAADILFAVTRDGTTTIPELANELGDLIPLGKGAGQTFKEIGASIGALTKGGLSTALAATQLKSLATSFQADLPKIVKSLGDLGVKTDEQAFKSLSFVDKIALLNKAFSGNEAAAFKALGRQEAVAAVFALGANNAEFLRQALEGVDKAAGSVDSATARMQETTEQTAARLRETFNRQLIELGNQLLPKVNEVLRDLTEYLKANGDQLITSIKGGVDQLVRMGAWAIDNGPAILTFFGVLAGAKVISGLAGVASGIGGIATAAGAARVAILAIPGLGPIIAAVGALALAATALKEAWKEMTSVVLDGSLDSFANGVNLDIRAAQARIDRAQQRNEVVGGNAVFVDPGAAADLSGEVAAATATLQETLSQGLDIATGIVRGNLDNLARNLEFQTQAIADASLGIENAQNEYALITAEVDRLSLEQARGNLLVQRDLVLAVNRQAEVEAEITRLQEAADEARKRAAQAETARANLSARFQQQVSDNLRAVLTSAGGGLIGDAQRFGRGVAGFLGQNGTVTTPKPVRTGTRARGRGLDEVFGLDSANVLRTAEAFADAAFDTIQRQFQANLDRRTSLIADSNERDLRLAAVRHARELAAAVKAGEDLALLLQVQGRERAEIIRSQEEAAAQTRAQAQQDFLTQLGRNQQIEALLLAGTDEGAIIALQNRQETELALVAGNLEAERSLREVHERDMTLLIEQQNAARIQALAGYADGVGSILGDIAGTMRAFGVESKLLAGIEIAAQAAVLQSKAFSAAAEAGLSFASGNVFKGTAQAIAAAAAQAQAVALFAKAAQFGAGGGGGGRGGSGGTPRRAPRLEGGGAAGERGAVTFVFNGPVYDSKRDAEAAFGRQALRGVRRLQDAPRGAPRARISEFES
jgi:TP901 family phage tail tape measure protein